MFTLALYLPNGWTTGTCQELESGRHDGFLKQAVLLCTRGSLNQTWELSSVSSLSLDRSEQFCMFMFLCNYATCECVAKPFTIPWTKNGSLLISFSL